MNVYLYIQPGILSKAKKALGVGEATATDEVVRQSMRLTAAYKEVETRRSCFYWSVVDRCALYTLAHNQQLTDEMLENAARDLHSVESLQKRMGAPELKAYNQFIYFLETVANKKLKSQEALIEAVRKFVDSWSPDEKLILRGLLRLAFGFLDATTTRNKRIVRSLRDAVQRVRPSKNPKVQETLKNRVACAIDELAAAVGNDAKTPPAELPPQPVTVSADAPEIKSEQSSVQTLVEELQQVKIDGAGTI